MQNKRGRKPHPEVHPPSRLGGLRSQKPFPVFRFRSISMQQIRAIETRGKVFERLFRWNLHRLTAGDACQAIWRSVLQHGKAETRHKKTAPEGGCFDRSSSERYLMLLFRFGGDLLSHVLRRSTIGATVLNGRVRDGIGCFTRAMTTKPNKEH